MPAVVCHWLLGKRVAEKARQLAPEGKFNDNMFFLGCQGPDVVFYQKLFSITRNDNIREYGYKMHKSHPSVLFASLWNQAAECDDDEQRARIQSYALGMCCHYALDTSAHPYICQLERKMKGADERGSKYEYHAYIESALDTILYRYETGGLISDLRLYKCVRADKTERYALAEIYDRILRDMYSAEPDKKHTRRLGGDMSTLFHLLDDPLTIRRPFIRWLESVLGNNTGIMSAYMRPLMEDSEYDYANIARTEWRNDRNSSEVSCEDFFEIFDRAERKTNDMMSFFMGCSGTEIEFADYTGERSFGHNVKEK